MTLRESDNEAPNIRASDNEHLGRASTVKSEGAVFALASPNLLPTGSR